MSPIVVTYSSDLSPSPVPLAPAKSISPEELSDSEEDEDKESNVSPDH